MALSCDFISLPASLPGNSWQEQEAVLVRLGLINRKTPVRQLLNT
jgi:hypothetical protein